MTISDLRAIAELMSEFGLTCVIGGGLHVERPATPPTTQTMVVPKQEIPPEAQALFRDLTDEELLMMSAAPLAQPEASP